MHMVLLGTQGHIIKGSNGLHLSGVYEPLIFGRQEGHTRLLEFVALN